MLLNWRSGQWYALNATAFALWREWHRTGDFEDAVRTVSLGYRPEHAARLRADAERLLAELVARGLISEGAADVSPAIPWGVPEIPVSRDGVPSGWRLRLAACTGFLLTMVVLRLPFRRTVRFVSWLGRVRCRETATVAQLRATLAAVDAVARRYPGRAACLELSVAAVVTMALLRRRAGWAVGIADDPYRFHAWVEAGGCPVLRPGEPRAGHFRRVLVF